MDRRHMLAGIVRTTTELAPASQAESTLAEFFETWGRAEATTALQPRTGINRLPGMLAGPRQHKLRANLDQLRCELASELAAFLREIGSG